MAQWKETVITEREAIELEQTARGAYATVKDVYSRFNGEYAFASTPELALAMLKDRLEAQRKTTSGNAIQ